MYPNPSNGIFRVEALDNNIVKVFNAQGRLVLEFTESGSFDLDLRNRPQGTYMIQLQNQKAVTRTMLLKF